jgi:exonuclease V gamma subunit
VSVLLEGGVRLSGVVRLVPVGEGTGERIVRYRASQASLRAALRPWIEHLLLCAGDQGGVWPGLIGFRGAEKQALWELPRLTRDEAAARLSRVIALRKRAALAPLALEPLAAEAAARILAEAPMAGDTAVDVARASLEAGYGDRVARIHEPEIALVWRAADPCGGDFLDLVRDVWMPLFSGLGPLAAEEPAIE